MIGKYQITRRCPGMKQAYHATRHPDHTRPASTRAHFVLFSITVYAKVKWMITLCHIGWAQCILFANMALRDLAPRSTITKQPF